jgi:predicted ATPase
MTHGTVWAGIRGNERRCEYAVIGDVVNLAARLAMRADWGTAWVSRDVYEHLRDSFRFDEVGELEIRGKSQRHVAYTFQDKETARISTLYAQPMVGRDAELSAVESFLSPLLERRFAGILHVWGDAGIGKSRLAYELCRRLQKEHNIAWFTCPADPILRQSLNPFRHFLREHFEITVGLPLETSKQRLSSAIDSLRFSLQTLSSSDLDPSDLMAELERTRPFLGAFLDLEWEGSLYGQLEPELRLENMMAAFKTLVKAESTRQPIVIHIEDAQWLDDDSRNLVQLLTRNVEEFPFAMICTSRYQDDGSRITFEVDEAVTQESIELKSLDQDSVRSLGRQLLNGPLSETLVTFLSSKTGGNPFFAEQLLLDLQERGALHEHEDAKWALREMDTSVPTKIGAVLVARLDRLTAQMKAAVQTAAVLGSEFEIRILSRMLQGEPEIADRVKEAESQQIWSAVEEMRYLFRHALMRDAAYEMQLQTRLVSLHRLAAEAIEEIYASDLSVYYADLAHHWGQAGVEERECHYAKEAGKRAVARHALDEAMQYLSRTLELIPKSNTDETYSILLSREQVAAMQGVRGAQNSDLDRLEALAKDMDDTKKQAEVAVRRAHFLEATGDFATAISVARGAIAFAQNCRDFGKEAAGYRLWGGALLRQGDYENARGQLDRALSLARRADDQQEETTVLLNLGTVSSRLGDYRDAQSWYEEALRLARKTSDQAGEGLILNNLGSALYHAGDPESAQTFFRESLRICREIGYRLAECNALGNLATVSADRGDYAAARTDYQEVLRLRREIGDKQGENLTLNNLGKIAYEVGDYTMAQSYLERALHVAKHLGARPIEGAVHVNLSSLFHLVGDNDEALRFGDEALKIAEELGELRMMGYAYINRGHALAALGRLEDAVDAYQKSASIRRELGHAVLAFEALGGLARIAMLRGHHETALAHVEQILSHLESGSLEGLSDPFSVYLTCHRVLAAKQDPRAQELLSRSFALLQDQAARIRDDAVRDSFLNNVATHVELVRTYNALVEAETG